MVNIKTSTAEIIKNSNSQITNISYTDEAVMTKQLFIIGIPDYLLAAVNSKGVTTNTFLSMINDTLTRDNFGLEIDSFFKNYLSKYDVTDIYAFNIILRDKLELPIPISFQNGRAYNAPLDNETSDATKRLINIYNDDTLDLSNILMSKINNISQLPFEIKSSENCLFVLPKKGFTNFITKNISEFKSYFMNFILIYMRKLYGEKVTYSSDVFRNFSRLVYQNS